MSSKNQALDFVGLIADIFDKYQTKDLAKTQIMNNRAIAEKELETTQLLEENKIKTNLIDGNLTAALNENNADMKEIKGELANYNLTFSDFEYMLTDGSLGEEYTTKDFDNFLNNQGIILGENFDTRAEIGDTISEQLIHNRNTVNMQDTVINELRNHLDVLHDDTKYIRDGLIDVSAIPDNMKVLQPAKTYTKEWYENNNYQSDNIRIGTVVPPEYHTDEAINIKKNYGEGSEKLYDYINRPEYRDELVAGYMDEYKSDPRNWELLPGAEAFNLVLDSKDIENFINQNSLYHETNNPIGIQPGNLNAISGNYVNDAFNEILAEQGVGEISAWNWDGEGSVMDSAGIQFNEETGLYEWKEGAESVIPQITPELYNEVVDRLIMFDPNDPEKAWRTKAWKTDLVLGEAGGGGTHAGLIIPGEVFLKQRDIESDIFATQNLKKELTHDPEGDRPIQIIKIDSDGSQTDIPAGGGAVIPTVDDGGFGDAAGGGIHKQDRTSLYSEQLIEGTDEIFFNTESGKVFKVDFNNQISELSVKLGILEDNESAHFEGADLLDISELYTEGEKWTFSSANKAKNNIADEIYKMFYKGAEAVENSSIGDQVIDTTNFSPMFVETMENAFHKEAQSGDGVTVGEVLQYYKEAMNSGDNNRKLAMTKIVTDLFYGGENSDRTSTGLRDVFTDGLDFYTWGFGKSGYDQSSEEAYLSTLFETFQLVDSYIPNTDQDMYLNTQFNWDFPFNDTGGRNLFYLERLDPESNSFLLEKNLFGRDLGITIGSDGSIVAEDISINTLKSMGFSDKMINDYFIPSASKYIGIDDDNNQYELEYYTIRPYFLKEFNNQGVSGTVKSRDGSFRIRTSYPGQSSLTPKVGTDEYYEMFPEDDPARILFPGMTGIFEWIGGE